MASENKVAVDPAEKLNEQLASRDARISELESQLKSVESTHAFQAERADGLEQELKKLDEKYQFWKKRAGKLEAQSKSRAGISVTIDGQVQNVIGDYRADNTFVEVKRGFCPEGVTLIAIDKIH